MTREDLDFLKDLQNELKIQTNDGNADPVYWGIMDKKRVYKPEGCGDEECYSIDGDIYDTLEEVVEYIDSEVEECEDDEIKNTWNNETNKKWDFDVADFADGYLSIDVKRISYSMEDELSRGTGCFLTKRAAKEYIERYGYNHNEPRTYAMTAYRNFELERFLKIFKEMDLNKIEIE